MKNFYQPLISCLIVTIWSTLGTVNIEVMICYAVQQVYHDVLSVISP